MLVLINGCSSYVEDPKWQRKFSIIWAAGVGIAVLAAVPQVVRALRRGRLFRGWLFGVSEGRNYTPAVGNDVVPPKSKRRVFGLLETLGSVSLWSLPGIELDIGQSKGMSGRIRILALNISPL